MDHRRRQVLIGAGGTLLLSLVTQPSLAAQVIGIRLWPAPAYTRITIEHEPEGLVYSTQLLKEPLRFVLDLEGVTLNPALRELTARVTNNDPFIRAIRVAQFQPRVVRLVFELKQDIHPQVFSLPAVAQYQARLVMDLYPTVDEDPLFHFLATLERERAIPPGVARSPEFSDPSQNRSTAKGDRKPGSVGW